MGEKGPVLYASNCSLARTSFYLFNISPHHPSNKGKCQAQEAKPHSEHRHNGHHPSVPSHVPPPGFSVPPGAGAVERGPVLTASTSLPAVYFLSDCKTPPSQGVFCVVSFLQTPRVKGQLAGTAAIQHNLPFLQFSIDQGAGPLGWAVCTHLRLSVPSTDLYLGGKFLPPMRPLPAALRSCSAHKKTTDEATVSP